MNHKLTRILFYLVILSVHCQCVLSSIKDCLLSNNKQSLIASYGNPSKTLISLLDALQLVHDGTLEHIKEITQAQWLRPSDLEREDCAEVYADLHDELLPLFKKLTLIDEINPSHTHYQHAIVLSNNSMANNVQRIAYLYELFKMGIRFEHIHLLGAQNLCTSDDIPLPFFPCTETQAITFLYHNLPKDSAFLAIPVTIYDIADRVTDDGMIVRGNTHSQVVQWTAQNPNSQSELWISNNPYITYQDSVIRSCRSHNPFLEVVGPCMKNDFNPIRVCLDTLARIIYQKATS